jgi:hypothetical protein
MRKVLVGVGSLVVVLIGTLVFVWYNLEDFVKDAIQAVCSEATQTSVSVYDVKLSLHSGEASILGLKVSNPDGFSDQNIFELGEIRIKIDSSTLNQNPIVIDEMVINAPSVVYEINKSGVSNVDILKSNLAQAVGDAGNSSGGSDEFKMIIRKLVVEGSRAKMRIAALGTAQQIVILPEILLTDIGKKSGGETAAKVARIIVSKLSGDLKSSVTKLGTGQTGGGAGAAN